MREKSFARSLFSSHYDSAMVETLLAESMVKADGWTLAQFVEAPPWLRDMYTRHAIAAHERIKGIVENINKPDPSEAQ
jgi:hypothetical protein